MKLEERLNAMIEEKDEKIEKLEGKIEAAEYNFNLSRLSWMLHQPFDNDKFSQQMPFPRLEMRMQRLSQKNWYNIEWIYGLVYKHYSETHSNSLLFIPLSQTTSNGGDGTFESRFMNNKLEEPFRDTMHILSEGKLFNLPTFIVCREKKICQKMELKCNINTQLAKMQSGNADG